MTTQALRDRQHLGSLRLDLSATGAISSLFTLFALGSVLDRLKVAWGPGDRLSTYVNVDLWNGFGYQASTHYDFPGGISPNRLDLPLTNDEITRMKNLGFCATHIDLRGFEPSERARVLLDTQRLLGSSVPTGREGDWVLYRVP